MFFFFFFQSFFFMWRREFFSRFRKRCGNKGNISKALFIPLKIFVPSDAKAPLISIKEEIEPVPPVGKIELVRRGFQPHRRLEFLPGKKKKKRLSRPSLMQNNISRYLSRLSPPIPNVPWHGRRGSRLQRGQGRGSVRLLREEGEQGLRGHVGSSEAKVVLIRRRRRLSLRRHGLRPAADAHSASARELRQQRAYDRRVHHVSGAHGGGTNFVFARVRAREEEGRERGSSSFGNEEEAERLAENKREVTELCSFSQSLNSPQSSLFHSLLSLLSFILSLSTLSLARSRSALPPRQSMETPTERDL